MIRNNQKFIKGINRRFSIEETSDPDRLYTLQNARIYSRTATNFVQRIKGYRYIDNSTTTFDAIYDSLFYQDELVVYWYDTGAGEVHVTFIDINTGSETDLSFSDSQVPYGEMELLENNIYLTPYDKQVNNIGGTWRINDFISSSPTVDLDDTSGGNLEVLTYYWYKARAVYNDGHKTITSYPEFRLTNAGDQTIEVTINDIPQDLDSNLTDIEIFRKEEGGDWFLIDRISPGTDPVTYTDSGKTTIQPLDERNYVWSQNALTQEIVRDRLVRANLEHDDKFLGWEEGDVDLFSSGLGIYEQTTLPDNATIDIYGQGRYNDGTVTPHKFLGQIETDSELQPALVTDPQTQPSNVDDLKEISYFAKFIPSSQGTITFNTFEMYNQNVPSLATVLLPEDEQDRPLNPHVFLGYKYVRFFSDIATAEEAATISDEDWTHNGSNYNGSVDSVSRTDDTWIDNSISNFGLVGDDLIRISFSSSGEIEPHSTGSSLGVLYKLRYEDVGGDPRYWIYELVSVDPLKTAASQGELSISLEEVLAGGNISSSVSNIEYINTEVEVAGILDTSASRTPLLSNFPTGKNHVYLILDTGTIYDQYDNPNLNNQDVIADYNASGVTPEFTAGSFRFSLHNVNYKDFGDATTRTTYPEDTDYDEVFVDFGITQYSPITETTEQALYLGTQSEFDQNNATLYRDYFNGYNRTELNLFEFQSPLEASIFENLITEDDLNQFQEDYPNQLVWGGPHILESNASGIRDFEFLNFKNISEEYGEIVRISYINNVLLTFCERGVNRINIGEVLTQQTGGEVFVDSSRFLNNDVWILKNLSDVKPRSIRQYENVLFFCDGKDVWLYSDSLDNISNGAIPIENTVDYIGQIDPKNKEYLLSDGEQSWVYSLESGQWQGPFTYSPKTSSSFRDNFYGVIDNQATVFNMGNTFGGESYDTIIESVANDLDADYLVKLFRKFYLTLNGGLSTDDVIFSYTNDYGSWTDKDLANKEIKNSIYNVGISSEHQNAMDIYWKIETQLNEFNLKSVAFDYTPRNRR